VSSLLRNEAAPRQAELSADKKELPLITKFDELVDHNLVHPNIVNAITKGMGHQTMTDVQSMTIHQGLQGTDM
jgi:ATP-dependent RNA helicase MSS116